MTDQPVPSADEYETRFGDDAIAHLLVQIEEAIHHGDDVRALDLDKVLQELEKRGEQPRAFRSRTKPL